MSTTSTNKPRTKIFTLNLIKKKEEDGPNTKSGGGLQERAK